MSKSLEVGMRDETLGEEESEVEMAWLTKFRLKA